ncbi:MAG: UpxY family transcription antiterminator [Chitinophagaceae bacterium]|jgi:transcription antitermination factor NusG|nr:MAG: UpxY family transcription antiterminator [Chitinophagaceae bacterium]
MPWYALYTKSRNEKRVAERLVEKGVEIYFPLQEEVHQWSDRRKKIKVPVFRSYIFVNLKNYKADSIPVLETAGAVRFLWWLGKPGVIRNVEIENIKRFLHQYEQAEISVRYKVGEHVAITAGPLKEKYGTIIDIQNKKAVLFIDSVGFSLTAQLPVNLLQKEKLRGG